MAQNDRGGLPAQERHEHARVIDRRPGGHVTPDPPVPSVPSAERMTRSTRCCSSPVRSSNAGSGAGLISAAAASAEAFSASSGVNTADAVSSAAICAMAAAIMYADTSSPAVSACALIALWIAGSVEIENRVFATPYSNTPCYGLKLSAMRVVPHFLLS
jgi:hypothetical protein